MPAKTNKMVLGQLLEGASSLLSGINDEDIGDTAALNAATNRCKGYKTAFKNKLRAAQASTKALAASPSAFNREYAQQAFEKFEDAYNTVCTGYARAITLCNGDKTVTTTMETKVQEVSDDFDKAQADFFKAMDKSEPAPQATPTMAAQTTGGRLPAYRTHYNAALKPFTLELEHTPADLRTWKERMHAYFASNELEQASFVEQNQYVLQCVSNEVSANIEPDNTEAANAEETGLIAIITKLFTKKYSGFSRRLELVTAKMKPGEGPMAYVGRMNKLYQEADLASMTVDKYRVFFLVAGLNHKTLRNKILDMSDPTYESVVEKIGQWTVTNATSKCIADNLEGETATVRAVRGPSQPKSEYKAPPASIKVTPATLKGRCFICGATNHSKDECPKKGNVKCTTCDKTNHLANICLSEYLKWRKANGGPRRSGKPQAKANKAAAAEPQSDESGGSDDE